MNIRMITHRGEGALAKSPAVAKVIHGVTRTTITM
jgi:hypothetical protein